MDPFGVLILVPILGVAVARRRSFRPMYRLDADRLGAAAQRPGRGAHVLAVAALYLVVCYFAGAGRMIGWLQGIGYALVGSRPVYSGTITTPGE